MKNESGRKSQNTHCPCSTRAEIIWQTIQADKSMCVSLMNRYTKDPVQKNEILSNLVNSLLSLSNQKFDAIKNLSAYIRSTLRNECIAFSKEIAKLKQAQGCLDDLAVQAEQARLAEDEYQVQRGEMTDMYIDYHRQIKEMVGEKDFELLHRWGVLKHSYAQMMSDLGLTEGQVRMKIAHLRAMIKPRFKKFWR